MVPTIFKRFADMPFAVDTAVELLKALATSGSSSMRSYRSLVIFEFLCTMRSFTQSAN